MQYKYFKIRFKKFPGKLNTMTEMGNRRKKQKLED